MIDLKQAITAGKLDQFIAEHEAETGDVEGWPNVVAIRSMAGTSKEAPAASPPDGSGD